MSHWKAAHKAVCARHAAQNLREGQVEGERPGPFSRWVNAWARTIMSCLSIALDLANYQWDRYETHVYVRLPAIVVSC